MTRLILHRSLDVEIGGCILMQFYRYTPFRNISLATLHRFWRNVAEHLERIFRTPYKRTESHSYRKPDHARARYAYTHGIFQDIATQSQRDSRRKATEQFRRLCHTQSHSHRFGATNRRHYLPLNKRDYFIAFFLLKHSIPIRISCDFFRYY